MNSSVLNYRPCVYWAVTSSLYWRACLCSYTANLVIQVSAVISEITRKLLIASKIKGVGRSTLLELASDRLFYELPLGQWHEHDPQLRGLRPGSSAFAQAVAAAEADIEQADKFSCSIISCADAAYPRILRTLSDRPPVLYIRGDPTTFSDKSVGIIGTRSPSARGQVIAERISAYFARQGWQIVSGLAKGVDAIAHQVAVRERAQAVAVLAHGLDKIYPKENVTLAEKILESGGLLVSEYPFGTPGFASNFIERDRIQAALSRGVVMVQSAETGGSWHACRAAIRYGRPLLVPAPTARDAAEQNPKARGNFLMAFGSQVDKMELLKCAQADLRHLIILKSKNDYPSAEESLLAVNTSETRLPARSAH